MPDDDKYAYAYAFGGMQLKDWSEKVIRARSLKSQKRLDFV
jgi:hypothetical protein